MSTTRRVYFYAVCLITLAISVWGAGIVLSLIFDSLLSSRPTLARAPGYPAQQLALGISMMVIAGAVWMVHWRTVQRLAGDDPVERGATLRKLYLSVVLAASALTSLMIGTSTLSWILGGAPFIESRPGALAAIVMSLAVWLYNWRVDTGDGPAVPGGKTLQRWYWYVVSAWSLAIVALSVINLLEMILDRAIFSSSPFVQASLWNDEMQLRIAGVVLGMAWWAFHWLHAAKNDRDSTLRQVYLYLFAITSGALAALVSISVTLFRFFQLLLDSSPDSQTLAGSLVWTLPTGLVGAAIWAYHWQIAREESAEVQERQSSARRVYNYLLSALGLAGIGSGAVVLFGLIINLLLGAIDPSNVIAATPGWWKDQAALFVVLLGVGTVVWLYFWLKVQSEAGRSSAERSAMSRKVYLYTFLCVSIIAVVAGTINIFYQALNGLFQSRGAFDVFNGMKWGLQALLVGGPSFVYHFVLLRDDIKFGAEQAGAKSVSIVVDKATAGTLLPRLKEALGVRLRVIAYEGKNVPPVGESVEEQVQAIIDSVRASPHRRLLLVLRGGEWKAFQYEEHER